MDVGLVIACAIIVFLLFLLFRNNKNKNIKMAPLVELKDEFNQPPYSGSEEVVKSLKNLISDISIITERNDHVDNDCIIGEDSIITVSKESNIPFKDLDLIKYSPGVPFWEHKYVYSYNVILGASVQQKEFYAIYRNNFLNSRYLDIEENLNYAFVLLFDFLTEYEKNKNLIELERRLTNLGNNYPKTKPYGVSFLVKKMEEVGDYSGINRLYSQNEFDYYDLYKLGNKYKNVLKLNEDDIVLLNKISYTSNNFCQIESCCIEVVKIFLLSIKKFQEIFSREEKSFFSSIESFAETIVQKHYRFRPGSYDYAYFCKLVACEIYTLVFKNCENTVREYYDHKRRLSIDFNYTNKNILNEYNNLIGFKIDEILNSLTNTISSPDSDTELELNKRNVTRWKKKLDNINDKYINDPKAYTREVISLANLNIQNPSIENIFYNAYKNLVKTDKLSALELYFHYLYYDLKSTTFNNRKIAKSIQKQLFKNVDELRVFESIISELVSNHDIEEAIRRIPDIYKPRRKKIVLNKDSINEVQQNHSHTVKILNEYLSDEYEDDKNKVESKEVNSKNIEIIITQKNKVEIESRLFSNDHLNETQRHFIALFLDNNCKLTRKDVDLFGKQNEVFVNQLIDSINEKLYEKLDDVIIDEDQGEYILNSEYYKLIFDNDRRD